MRFTNLSKVKTKLKKSMALALSLAMGLTTMTVYAADPIRQTSQETSTLTIHVLQQIDTTEEGMDGSGLADQKVPDTASPLSGVTVTIQQVTYDDNDIENYTTTGDTITVVTGDDGLATFNEVPNGRYVLKYTNLPQNVRTQIKDHFVDLPSRNADGTGWNYDVHVYPKNETVYGSVILTKTGDDGEVLAGVKFRLYYKNADGTYTKEYEDIQGKSHEYVTNENGQLTVSDLPDASYAFIETASVKGYGIDTTPLEFTVTQSGTVKTAEDGTYVTDTGLVYEVGMDNYKKPEVHKGVKSVVNQHAGYDIDALSTWVISPTVPKNIEKYTKFVVTDDVDGLNGELKFGGIDTINVVVSDTDLSETKFDSTDLSAYTLLKAGTDYKKSYDEESQTFTITFINGDFVAGRTSIAKKYVYIVFGCYFDTEEYAEDDILGEAIYNQASLTYNNSYMTEDDTLKTETPEIHTGGVAGYKYTTDASSTTGKKAVAGAEFKIAATEEDALAGNYLKNEKGEDIVATSDANGIFTFKGLAYGEDGVDNDSASREYWIVETKAPANYLLIGKPVSTIVNKDSHKYTTIPTLQIKNVPTTDLPKTGGLGILPFVIGGSVCLLVLFGLGAYLMTEKKKKSVK